MKVGNFPPSVVDALEGRGWRKDAEITPERAFDEYCNWHGLIGWGPELRNVMAEIKECTE